MGNKIEKKVNYIKNSIVNHSSRTETNEHYLQKAGKCSRC
jgi:hypothetical protein